VRGYVGSGILSLLDRGPYLPDGESERMDRVVRRRHAAVGIILMKRAPALISSRAAFLTSSTPSQIRPSDPTRSAKTPGRSLRAAAEVRVATGLAERLTGNDEARPVEQALPHCEPVVRTADIADGREAAHEHRVHDARRAQCNKGGRKRRVRSDVDEGCDDVHVRVHQPRHQRLPTQVDPRP
jgi:hypothetical protein